MIVSAKRLLLLLNDFLLGFGLKPDFYNDRLITPSAKLYGICFGAVGAVIVVWAFFSYIGKLLSWLVSQPGDDTGIKVSCTKQLDVILF